ncbi:MAG: amidohydrolase family protein [Planctomycetes bacterium]|nr:amidohydrolase family protein [Planctomycetota bacterium]
MRSPWHLPAFILPLLLCAAQAVAQIEEPPPPPAEGEQPAATGTEQNPSGADRERGNRERRGNRPGGPGRRGPRRAPIAIEAGHIHPVSGPVIEDGIVLIRGDRIVAIGKKGEVEVPADATTRSFPTGHVYPGLIDASTDAFTDPAISNANLDPGLAIGDDLQPRHNRDDQLAAAGITTAYTAGRGGQGAIVRPTHTGFEVWPEKEHAGLQVRMTNGPTPSHALQRQQQLEGQLRLFDGLDKYKKAKEDHNKALDQYQKDWEAYLEYHKKNKGSAQPAPATPSAETPAERPAGGPGGDRPFRRGRRPPGGGGNAEAGEADDIDRALELLLELAAQDRSGRSGSSRTEPAADTATPQEPTPKPQGQDPPQGQNPRAGQPEAAGEKKNEAPKRPTYPKAPPEDPAKETLLAVLDGKMPLRVEAHRPDELRAALTFLSEKEVPILVLEKAYGACAIAADLAATGAQVVLTDVLPSSMPKAYEDFDPQALPAKLDAAGVPFAIASGGARLAPLLPTMAAAAIGKGLAPASALRAITLTAAEILGVQQDTGSLQTGKFADLVVFDRPLFESDSHVLLVLGRGRTEFEVK